ncbi:hypothetical protein [Vreelandella sp. EE27]
MCVHPALLTPPTPGIHRFVNAGIGTALILTPKVEKVQQSGSALDVTCIQITHGGQSGSAMDSIV